MSVAAIREVQQQLKDAGFYTGIVDGAWGKLSREALTACIAAGKGGNIVSETKLGIAWSAKVSPAFATRVCEIAELLKIPDSVIGTGNGSTQRVTGADMLMACMAFETGETFSPSIKNGAGAPYYGLIQFGKAAATDVGTTVEALVKMTAEQQLEYVYLYFKPLTGKLKTVSDLYMKILWPAAVGKPEDFVLWTQKDRPTTYLQNKGLDVNKDGWITKAEAASKVTDKLTRGLQAQFRRPL
ncbi:hypothetical protein pEaSNUABM37_00171 [Erwinia phage pEa_SNUABM_37]|nr:hypothetical protein pEaSNUABM37_00171 [Erwinia phage pEa_SNUABM_37]QXO10641.1 hypothetical protein pEaSNUABM48_00171 [Erwinia phage pEa_SNUABM_48]